MGVLIKGLGYAAHNGVADMEFILRRAERAQIDVILDMVIVELRRRAREAG